MKPEVTTHIEIERPESAQLVATQILDVMATIEEEPEPEPVNKDGNYRLTLRHYLTIFI